MVSRVDQQLQIRRSSYYYAMGLAGEIVSKFKIAFIAQIVEVTCGAVLLILLARLLSTTAYGLLFLAISIFSIAKLFSTFGVAKSASRYISEYKETQTDQIPHILRTSFILNLGTITIVCLILVAGNNGIISVIGEPELSPLLLLGSPFVAFSSMDIYVRQVLQGFEDITISSALSAFNKVCRLVLVITFVILGYGALGALTGYIVSYAIMVFLGGLYIFQNKYENFDSSRKEADLDKKIAEYSLPVGITQSAHTIDHHLDKVLIGFFLGPISVAYYTVGKQAVQLIEMPMSALGFTLSPTLGSQKAQGNIDTAAEIYETALAQSLLLYIPVASGVIILAEPSITLILGTDYRGVVPVLQILAIFAVLQAITKLTSHGLDYLGRARERAVAKGVTAVLNVSLNIILIPTFGVEGAALATVATFMIYTAANIYIMHLEMGLRINWLLIRTGYSVCVAILMSAVVLPFTGFISGFFTLGVTIALGGLVWLITVLALGLISMGQVREIIFDN